MSNEELAAAIAYASNRMREIAPNAAQYVDWLFQLRALMAAQRERAKQPSEEA